MTGILLYTAAPDSEGTLGGLVELGDPLDLGEASPPISYTAGTRRELRRPCQVNLQEPRVHACAMGRLVWSDSVRIPLEVVLLGGGQVGNHDET